MRQSPVTRFGNWHKAFTAISANGCGFALSTWASPSSSPLAWVWHFPGLRDQALQVHTALLAALAPATVPPAAPDTTYADAGIPADIDLDTDKPSGTPGVVALAVPEAGNNATAFLTPLPHPDIKPASRSDVVTNAQTEALRNYISRKYKVASDATAVLVNTAYKVGAS